MDWAVTPLPKYLSRAYFGNTIIQVIVHKWKHNEIQKLQIAIANQNQLIYANEQGERETSQNTH